MSTVRKNLLTRPGYTPYCGGVGISCSQMPRTYFNGDQFQCPYCGWASEFEPDFIEQYKAAIANMQSDQEVT